MCPLSCGESPMSLKSKSTSQSGFFLSKCKSTQRTEYGNSLPWPLKHGYGTTFCGDRFLISTSFLPFSILPSALNHFLPILPASSFCWYRTGASPFCLAATRTRVIKLSSWGGGKQAVFLPDAYGHDFLIGIWYAIFQCWSTGKLKIIPLWGY